MNPRYKFSVDAMNEYGEDIDEYNYEKGNPEQYDTQPVRSINPDDNDPNGFKFEPLPSLSTADIPQENQKDFPSLSDTFTNNIPEGYDAAVMQFYPMTLDGVDPFNRKYDISFNALYYLGLGGLGGKEVTWQLGREFMSPEEKKRKDMNDNHHHCYCDSHHGQTFLIEDLLNNAMTVGYKGYPPIFTQAGHPNCLIDGTRVMTNTGFKYFEDITETDMILSMNPDNGDMEYVKYKQKIKYEYSGDMIEFIARGHHSIVTPDHRVIYRNKYGKCLHIDTAEELATNKYIFKIPRTGNWETNNSSEKDVLIARFWGWYLSEGCAVKRKGSGNRYQAAIAQQKKGNYKRILDICNKLSLNPRQGKNQIYFFGDFAKYLYDFNLGYSHQKHIPQFIKDMGKNALNAFLEEFTLGDGHSRIRNCFGSTSTERVFFTSSTRLRDDIIELLLKTGRSARWYIGRKKGKLVTHKNGTYATNNDNYIIQESKSNNSIFSGKGCAYNKSQINKLSYTGKVHCLELEKNGVFCFEYNGCISWTGNCNCSLVFNKSSNFPSYQSISDTCPSMPITNDQAVKDKRKQEIFNAIPDTIQIYSYVGAPMYITDKMASVQGIVKYAADSAIDMNRPIRVNKNSIAVMSFGFWQAIPEGALGFVLKAEGSYVEIYYIDFLCKARIKRENIDIIDNLRTSDSSDLNKDVYFIMSDGKLGALCYERSGRYHAYFPDIDRIKEIDDVTVLTI